MQKLILNLTLFFLHARTVFRRTGLLILALVLLPISTLCADSMPRAEKLVVLGWVEEAMLRHSKRLKVHAKLDTGADTSSIHAENLERFQKSGEDWVRFKVSNRYGETAWFERKIRRVAEIKRKRGSPHVRPVVKLGICVGQFREVVEFTLVDRSNFSSIALIGRNFLAGKILVDSSDSYTAEPDCDGQRK